MNTVPNNNAELSKIMRHIEIYVLGGFVICDRQNILIKLLDDNVN